MNTITINAELSLELLEALRLQPCMSAVEVIYFAARSKFPGRGHKHNNMKGNNWKLTNVDILAALKHHNKMIAKK